ncbi:MAG: response regulator, partial [Thermoanaerobaculum sp.]|nr:response regulator [Thermoanaerobaculum sp.]
MKPTILLVDYEPRNATRYAAALASLGVEFLSATDLDGAVAHCSKVEPSLVLLTSVLPRVKVEDAITQLRARAGLRSTPFVVLMSGYNGRDTRADAERLGAQDILPKPFSDQQLRDCVRFWLESSARGASLSEKTKVEILEALKQQGAQGGGITSQELFGDLLEEEGPSPADTQRIRVEPKAPVVKKAPTPETTAPQPPSAPAVPAQPASPPRQVPAPKGVVEDVERVLEATIADVLKGEEKRQKPVEDTGTKRVEELLSQTLSGLEVPVKPKPAAPP